MPRGKKITTEWIAAALNKRLELHRLPEGHETLRISWEDVMRAIFFERITVSLRMAKKQLKLLIEMDLLKPVDAGDAFDLNLTKLRTYINPME